MAAWGEAHGAGGKVRMLSDMHSELTQAWDCVLDAAPFLGNARGKRFAAIIEDGKVKAFSVEPDGTGLTCSLAPEILAQL